jgi:hypothetical protein
VVGELLGFRLGARGLTLGEVDGFGVTFLVVGDTLGDRLGSPVVLGVVGLLLGEVDGFVELLGAW